MSSKRNASGHGPFASGSQTGHLRYATAAALVATALLVRFLLGPVFGPNHAYAVFYPVVLFAAYSLGVGPAAMTMGVSAILAYWMFVPPPFTWKGDASVVAGFSFYLLNCSTAIYLIAGLKGSLGELAARQGRAEARADNHAELFHELSERVTNHLQLISGLLALQAQGEQDEAMSGALARASERSLLIAQIHRQVSGQADEPVDFAAFARSLLASAAERRGAQAPELLAGPVLLPRDQATSLGVALLECVGALSARHPAARLRVRLSAGEDTARFRISRIDGRTGISTASLDSALLLNAMVEQLGGRLRLAADAEGSGLELTFPRTSTAPAHPAPTSTYH